MLLALSIERFLAVCKLGKSRLLYGKTKAYIVITLIPVGTLLVYLPHLLRAKLSECLNNAGNILRNFFTIFNYFSSFFNSFVNF